MANHQYLHLHEVSREKSADGKPKYDAFIHIGWNEQKKSYTIIWLDNFWGIDAESIGTAAPKENELPFLWKDDKGAAPSATTFCTTRRPILGAGPWTMS